MSRTAAAPGFSIAAQLRQAKAELRRAARKKVERLERELKEAKEELRVLELAKNGKAILDRAPVDVRKIGD